ncbi:MAG: hypothetical protein JST86_06525 [Bacteroidetes bacterium]|nr:hypothetical protein [Bacteroidota bacterium]
MDTILLLTWHTAKDKTEYFINHQSMGFDEAGYNAAEKKLELTETGKRIVIAYPAGNDGGGDPHEAFPFYHRLNKLLQLAAGKNITVVFEPQFK